MTFQQKMKLRDGVKKYDVAIYFVTFMIGCVGLIALEARGIL